MKRILSTLTLTVLLTGCITADKARMICPQVETIAARGTKSVLLANPQHRAGFEAAAVLLEQAAKDTTLDFTDLAAVLDKLPVRELQSEDARLLIDTGLITIKLLFPNDPALDVSDYESATVIAGCLAGGIHLGLQ